MSHYRNTDYTIFNLCHTPEKKYYQQCEISFGNEHKRVWVDNTVLEKTLDDLFLEFKTNGSWDGIAWRVLNISPHLTDAEIKEMHVDAIIITSDDVRNYKQWNK